MKRIKYRAIVDKTRLEALQEGILSWFAREGRDLPWRHTHDPYAILVSEILLHQTTVATVAPVYREFMAQFPTVGTLADAPVEKVKAITDPLGYKVRGTWLKEIATAVQGRHGGTVPATLEELMDLPGVGRYTAGAVLSFAYLKPAGVLDTNVQRILRRFFGVAELGTDATHRLWALAEAVVPPEAAWGFNQGLMDFGATVCKAKKPQCGTCALRPGCPSADGGMTAGSGDPIGVMFWEREKAPRVKKPRAVEASLEDKAVGREHSEEAS